MHSGNRVESLVREIRAYCLVTTVMWWAHITLLYQPITSLSETGPVPRSAQDSRSIAPYSPMHQQHTCANNIVIVKMKIRANRVRKVRRNIQFNSAPAHSTRPHDAKKPFALSFQPKFLKISFTKVTATSIKSYVPVKKIVPSLKWS